MAENAGKARWILHGESTGSLMEDYKILLPLV